MNRTAVEEIKSRLPIEEILGSYIKLEKSGKSLKARCPFHNEKSASFFVSPDRGGYYCFGCNAKGDIFTFVQQFEGLDFRGALKVLAERAGVPLVYDQKADGEKDKLYRIMEEAASFFESEFSKSQAAKEYVKGRGINDETRSTFRVGWAPEGWRHLHDHLKSKGWSTALMEKAGLIKAKEGSKTEFYDRFRGRVIFPISDSSGRVIAFSGRILVDDGKSAKYLNSPDTPLYDKSSVLYGLDKAKSEIRRLNYSIFVEGQMDLVMSHQAGIKNTVASSGTALAEDAFNKEGAISNLGLVRRLSQNVIIAFDSDAAGKKAALRAANIALSLGMDVKIAEIVGGKDPADLVREDVTKWRDVLRNAVHVVEFELGNVLKEISDERKLSKAVFERVLPLVARIETSSDQSIFVQKIADKTKMLTDTIWQDVKLTREKQLEAMRKESQSPSAINASAAHNSSLRPKASWEQKSKLDLVERQLFGIMYLMEKSGMSKVAEYRDKLSALSGDSYKERCASADSMKEDLMFEAEGYFGREDAKWDKHIQELFSNFESELINKELEKTMFDLRTAEKSGNQDSVISLAKKCQELSMKKRGIVKGKEK